eukprot:10053540-Heterocapsa_arctica.AAC.1
MDVLGSCRLHFLLLDHCVLRTRPLLGNMINYELRAFRGYAKALRKASFAEREPALYPTCSVGLAASHRLKRPAG